MQTAGLYIQRALTLLVGRQTEKSVL